MVGIAVEQMAATGTEPQRAVCDVCIAPVLIALVPALPRERRGPLIVTAEPYEWEPRAACQSCAWTRNRLNRAVDCARCGGSGYVGSRRPRGARMLAVDCAWSDEGRIRLLAPGTKRRAGEALYELHVCSANAICAIDDLCAPSAES